MEGGSSLENDMELGYAHFAEHLLFKLRFRGEGIGEYIESLGGYSNAYTSHDDVVVEISVMNEHVEAVLEFLEGIFSQDFSDIPEKDFSEELGVVLEEMLMYEDEPTENLFHALMENSFTGHPYGRKIIGTTESLKNSSIDSLNRFYREKLIVCPFLVVVGGFEGDITFNLECRDKPSPEIIEKWPVDNRVLLRHDQEKDYFMAGWKLPVEDGRMAALNKLIYTISYGMDGGRLYNELVYENPVFDNFSFTLAGGRYGTFFLQTAAFSPLREKRRLEKWQKEWDSLHFNQFEVAKAKEVILSSRYFSSEGIGDEPYRLGKSYVMYGDPHRLERDYFYHLFHFTAKELNAFKEEHLGVDKAVLGMAMPKKSKFTFTDLITHETPEHQPSETFVRKKKRGVSASAFIREDSSFLSLYLLKKAGVMAEKPGREGGFSLFLESLCCSAEGMTRDETEAYLDRFGITLAPMMGNNTGGFKLKVRDSFVNEAMEILKRTLQNPLKEEDFNQEKQFAISNSSLKREDPLYRMKERIHQTLFPGTPYCHLIGGTEESLSSTTFDDVREIGNNYFSRNNWAVGISGSISRNEMENITSYLSEKPIKKGPSLKQKEPIILGDKVEKLVVPGRKQLYISRVFHGPDIHNNDFEPVRFMEQFLMGQNSPYFQELREENGLVYSLDLWGMGGLTGGYIAFTAITSPEKQNQVMDGINKVVETLHQGSFNENLLDEMKNSTKFQHAQSVVRNDYHAFNLALEEALDFPKRHYLDYPEMVDAMNREKIMELSEKYLSDGLWIISESE